MRAERYTDERAQLEMFLDEIRLEFVQRAHEEPVRYLSRRFAMARGYVARLRDLGSNLREIESSMEAIEQSWERKLATYGFTRLSNTKLRGMAPCSTEGAMCAPLEGPACCAWL